MLCILPVFSGDADRLFNLLIWIRQLGGCRGHDAAIIADADTPSVLVLKLKDEANKSFDSVSIATTDAPASGWIPGANTLFLRSAQFARDAKVPFLFLEPDAVPLSPGWLDKIDIQRMATGADYMGVLVPCDKPGLPQFHMTGVGVYPASAYDDLSNAILSKFDVAFDLSTADILVSKVVHSKLFHHLWGEFNRPPRFSERRINGTDVFDLNYLNANAVLFHRNKDGSLIQELRKKAGIQPKTFIQLGKPGDVILLMAELLWLYQQTGVKQRLITSNENMPILDGVSYVEGIGLPVGWWTGLKYARDYARDHFGGAIITQCFSNGFINDINTTHTTFMECVHGATGVPMELIGKLPLIFDRRDRGREAKLIPKTNGKPYIVVNLHGISSPFSYDTQLMSMLQRFRSRIDIIDISQMRLPRIYDLIGIYDRAIGSIHVDTATLHLAAASPSPFIALVRGGWGSSTPRGNCVMKMNYSEVPQRVNDIMATVTGWIEDNIEADVSGLGKVVSVPNVLQGKKANPSFELIHVCVPLNEELFNFSKRFVDSYLMNPPGIRHRTTVVLNGSPITEYVRSVFSKLPSVRYVVHDNSGHDIGAFLAASKVCNSDIALFMGSHSYFSNPNWMRRVIDSWLKFGPGLYGASASFEVTPHLNSTGFWCSPKWLKTYPFPVVTRQDRYNFEHGINHSPTGNDQMILWKRIHREGVPVMLVTCEGEYQWWDWRKPDNIFRRGDQSNMIIRWRMADIWNELDEKQKIEQSRLADTITDQDFDTVTRTYKWTLKVPALPG